MIGDVVLEDGSVRLRPVTENDLPHFQRWLNDPDVYHWIVMGVMTPPTWEDDWLGGVGPKLARARSHGRSRRSMGGSWVT